MYLLAYLIGLCAGVAANLLLDVQLRRPALSKQITLAAFGILVGIIIYQTNTRMEEWLLPTIWTATGVLAGLGSRESRAPIA
jgi:xanthosine utilization system XapX-like protein